MIYGGLFDLDKKIERLDEINKIMNESDFWNRSLKDDILKENSYLSNLVNDVREVVNKIDSNIVILLEEIDDEILELITYEY